MEEATPDEQSLASKEVEAELTDSEKVVVPPLAGMPGAAGGCNGARHGECTVYLVFHSFELTRSLPPPPSPGVTASRMPCQRPDSCSPLT